MIIVKLSGGLGNQMFQYALARHLSIKHKSPLRIDLSKLNNYGYRKFALGNFKIQGEIVNYKDYFKILPQKSLNLLSSSFFGKKIANKIFPYPYEKEELLFHRVLRDDSIGTSTPLRYKNIVAERYFHFDPEVLELPNNILLLGYWLNEKYFIGNKEDIKKEYQLIEPLDKKNHDIAQQIASTNSISIHIRRGDFLSPQNSGVFKLLNMHYYHRCVEFISANTNSPLFFIFSNDPKWVKKNFNIDYKTIVVEHNSEDEGYKDLHLMSLCKHNITANSSLSWWAAWLNGNRNKIVLTPKVWYNLPRHNIADMVPKEWIQIEN